MPPLRDEGRSNNNQQYFSKSAALFQSDDKALVVMARPPITRKNPYTPKSGAFAGQTFHTERQYRNALAKKKGFRSWHEQQRAIRKVTAKDFGAFRTSQKEADRRALDALSHMRQGDPLVKAAKKAGTTPNTVIKYAGSALEKRSDGRWAAKKSDRLYRPPMNVLTTEGMQFLSPGGKREASLISNYMNDIGRFLATGDKSRLKKYKGKKVAGFILETDPDIIEAAAHKGELDFEDIYEKAA